MSRNNKKKVNEDASEKLKKGYQIVFYDSDDDAYVIGFDNVKDICRYKKLPINSYNVGRCKMQIYKALKRNPPITRMLGSSMYIYLIDTSDDED